MSLLDPQMLPEWERKMPQMYDLLQAEDRYIEAMYRFADFLEDRMVLLRPEGITLPVLEDKILKITGYRCKIIEDSEHLTIRIRYYYDAQDPFFAWRDNVLKYVPTHLKVIMDYLQEYSGQTLHYVGAIGSGAVRLTAYPTPMDKVVKREVGLTYANANQSYIRYVCRPMEDK